MGLMTKIRKRHIALMQKTLVVLGNILKNVSHEQATTVRDGETGWTVLETVCHLRDYDEFYYQRAKLIIEEEYPTLPAYDQEALAVERKYNEQNLAQVYAELVKSREQFVDFFHNLTNEQWEHAGLHPEDGHFTMTDAVMQVSRHDLNHIEQITRILAEGITTQSKHEVHTP
jgi:uncharacterized damage-inducible protein DinB